MIKLINRKGNPIYINPTQIVFFGNIEGDLRCEIIVSTGQTLEVQGTSETVLKEIFDYMVLTSSAHVKL